MMVAAASVGTASGTRAWIGARFADRLGPRRMRAITLALAVAAVLVASVAVGGSGG
jgi:hypothetical protein